MNEEKKEYIHNWLEEMEEFIAQYTNDEVGFNIAVAELDGSRPLKDAVWSENNQKYEWMDREHVMDELNDFAGDQAGWFDNIHIVYPMWGQFGPSAAYGGGSYIRDNISRSQGNIINDSRDYDGIRIGMWHEAIHGLELQYWLDYTNMRNIPRGTGITDNAPIELHRQAGFGYVGREGGAAQTENYYRWMGDLTTGKIRDLSQVGWQNYESGGVIDDGKVGFGQAMYDYGPVRFEYDEKPGAPFPR